MAEPVVSKIFKMSYSRTRYLIQGLARRQENVGASFNIFLGAKAIIKLFKIFSIRDAQLTIHYY